VKKISTLVIGVATSLGFAASLGVASALAEDLTAGKTAAQLFRSDCSACHHAPNGLVKDRDVSRIAAFLREHYTTKSESADALAAYVSGFASPGSRNRTPDRTRTRSDVDAPGDAPARRPREDGDTPRPPRGVGAGSSDANPASRLRSYLSSGLDSQNASAAQQSDKTGTPKPRKRRPDDTAAAASPQPPAAASRAAEPAAAAPDASETR
jgi:hypothetical protein